MRYGVLRFPSPDDTQKNCGRADGRDGRHFLAEENHCRYQRENRIQIDIVR